MMFFFLSHLSHPVHKIDRIDKIIEFESALDLVFLQFPFRDLFHATLELALFDQVSHTGTTSITRKSFCNGKSSGLKTKNSANIFDGIQKLLLLNGAPSLERPCPKTNFRTLSGDAETGG